MQHHDERTAVAWRRSPLAFVSKNLPYDFRFDAAPFDCLTPTQRAQVVQALSPAEFAAGAVVLTPEMEPEHALLVASGHLQLVEDAETIAVYGPRGLCAVRAVLAGRCSGTILALDPVRAWRIPKRTIQDLIHANAMFSAALFATMAGQLATAAQSGKDREFLSLMMVRIGDAYIRKPHFVDGSMDIVSVCRLLSEQGLTNTLVRDRSGGVERIGMFTTTDLRDALLRPTPPQQLPVASVAQFGLVMIASDAALYDALLLMIRHRVHRVLVQDGEQVLGVLSQLDLMGFVSNHSHLIAMQVEQAGSIAELRTAALQLDGLIAVLHSGGARVEVIAGLVSELNSQVFARLWSLLAPADLVANSCLVVMGSEGRGEQILKTDQDNALLLRDGYHCAQLDVIAIRFNQALLDFGYPRCPGNIMLVNPLWRQPVAGFKETLRQWLYGDAPDAAMHLAIFMDARAVAGDAGLLDQAREHLHGIATASDASLARFVAAVEQFSEPTGWWARLTRFAGRDEQSFDLKKLGTFPIVHGVRALALEHRLTEVSTTRRIRILVNQGHLAADLARDLVDALHFLMGLKLKNNLRQRQLQLPGDNLVRLSEFGTLERDLLKDSLAIIKRFKQHLRQHFKLDTL